MRDVRPLLPGPRRRPVLLCEQHDDFSNHASWYVNGDARDGPLAGPPVHLRHAGGGRRRGGRGLAGARPRGRARRASRPPRRRVPPRSARPTSISATTGASTTGGDVTLYDFVVMVETDLATGRQELLLSVPVEAVPALRADVSVREDGSATMSLDHALETTPIRLAYQVAPTPALSTLLKRMEAGEVVSDAELEGALGEQPSAATDSRAVSIYASDVHSGRETPPRRARREAPGPSQANPYYAFTRDTPLFERRGDAYVAARHDARGRQDVLLREDRVLGELPLPRRHGPGTRRAGVRPLCDGGRRRGRPEALCRQGRAVRRARRDPAPHRRGGPRVRGQGPQRHRERALRGAPLRGGP